MLSLHTHRLHPRPPTPLPPSLARSTHRHSPLGARFPSYPASARFKTEAAATCCRTAGAPRVRAAVGSHDLLHRSASVRSIHCRTARPPPPPPNAPDTNTQPQVPPQPESSRVTPHTPDASAHGSGTGCAQPSLRRAAATTQPSGLASLDCWPTASWPPQKPQTEI